MFVYLLSMTRLSTINLLLVFLIAGVSDGQTTRKIVGILGKSVSLPCLISLDNVTSCEVKWFKEDKVIARRNCSLPFFETAGRRLYISDTRNLNISDLLETDEGVYHCDSSQPSPEKSEIVQLMIASGPTKVVTTINPASILPNGTYFVRSGTFVNFSCSTDSYSFQSLSWVFEDPQSGNLTKASGNQSALDFYLENIQPIHQGWYTCRAQNTISNVTKTSSILLLVYYAPERHQECYSVAGNDSSYIMLHCDWEGGYPAPTLHWTELSDHMKKPIINKSMATDKFVVSINQSLLFNGQTFMCTGHYKEFESVEEKSCSITLKSPYPEGDPIVAAVEGSNVTLTCLEKASVPPARTTWQRTVKQTDIFASSKYIMSQDGPTFKLTIVNVTKEDGDFYFCRSKNPLLDPRLEILLTVKSSAANTGAVIGTFIAFLIFAAGIAIGTLAYRNRDRICLGNAFSHIGEERGDILNLVESDEEEVFSEPVTRITTEANGHASSLVQIHRFPSSNHVDEHTTHPGVEVRTLSENEPDQL